MWYNQNIKDILNKLNSSLSGLDDEQVIINRKKYGKNIIENEKQTSLITIILHKLIEPLTLVLIGVILICLLIGEYKEVVIISLILIVDIIIATTQEIKAQNALEALEEMVEPKSVVIRNKVSIEVKSTELVVGDIVVLEAGNFIPADIRIIEAAKLLVDESALTGESTYVEKNSDEIAADDVALADKFNMLYTSTFITNGRAKGVVVAVGEDTEIGKIAQLLKQTKQVSTPLQQRLAHLSKIVSILAFVLAAIVFFISYFNDNVDITDAFITSITLAVAVIPECLPIIVSIILAISVGKMAKNNAAIKKLPAVESLGTVNVICTDKTGTLTLNKMSVVDYFIGNDIEKKQPLTKESTIVKAMILCNDSFIDNNQNPIGDPTELALTYYGNDLGINELKYREKYPRIDEIPFDSNRKLMSTVHKMDNKQFSYTKGAIDQILALCNRIELADGSVREITADDIKQIHQLSDKLSHDALRVLAFAYTENNTDYERDMIFIGAVGMIDPEKKEAKIAIEKAKNSGIKTVMITGDHPTTAYAIAQKLNMVKSPSEVISGPELDKMSDEELTKHVNEYTVYARVSPEHKVRIVQALQAHDNIVSMTGDGVNDAPSLQAAHIGVAMGVTGTDVAKQASSMILMDDNIGTIVYAVEEGRNIYNKIKRAIEFVLGTNFGEVLGIILSLTFAGFAPLGAIHVLWINLIVESLIAIPIGMDVNDDSVMNEKPRPKNESIFKNIKTTITLIALLSGLSMFIAFWYMINSGVSLLLAQTVAFAIMSTGPMIYVLSLRTPTKSIFKSKPWQNPYLCLAIIIGFILNITIIYAPFNDFFKLTALNGNALLVAIIGIIVPTIGLEIYKAIRFKAYK